MSAERADRASRIAAIRDYWDSAIHDAQMSTADRGSARWFEDLAAYRYEKLDYLERVFDFNAWAGLDVLELGCGVGLDLARLAAGGARVTGIDLSANATQLAASYLKAGGLDGRVVVGDGEDTGWDDASFDLVYAHGVAGYTDDPVRMIEEARRLLRPGGLAVFMFYHSRSWLSVMSRLTSTSLEHDDAPAFAVFAIPQVRAMFSGYSEVTVLPERFPVPTRLHHGLKAFVFNRLFVPGFNLLPKAMTRGVGWHLMVEARK